MAGLNHVVRTNLVTEFTDEDGDTRRLFASLQGELLFEIWEDHNGAPSVIAMLDADTGENASYEGPTAGYVGTSIKEVGENEYVISRGTPDFAYSVPFARRTCEHVEQGIGYMRADEDVSLEGEAADVHTRALSLPQVGLDSDLRVMNNERGHEVALAVTDALDRADTVLRREVNFSAFRRAEARFSEEELKQELYEELYANSTLLEERAAQVAVAYARKVAADANQVQAWKEAAEEELPRLREREEARVEQLETAWTEKSKLQDRVSQLESQLEEAKAFDPEELSNVKVVKALHAKGMPLKQAYKTVHSLL